MIELPGNWKYIVVEGNIGAGKTSLAKMFASDFGGDLVLEEFAENTFLPQFYKNPGQFAFPLELSFLAARYKQLTTYFRNDSSVRIISDYHIQKSLLFATVNLPEHELELFRSFFDVISAQIPEPDAVIYLNSGTDQLQKNIRKRNRDFEHEISSKYLEKVNSGYEKLLNSYPFSRLIRVDSSALDFINNGIDYQFIINLLK